MYRFVPWLYHVVPFPESFLTSLPHQLGEVWFIPIQIYPGYVRWFWFVHVNPFEVPMIFFHQAFLEVLLVPTKEGSSHLLSRKSPQTFARMMQAIV